MKKLLLPLAVLLAAAPALFAQQTGQLEMIVPPTPSSEMLQPVLDQPFLERAAAVEQPYNWLSGILHRYDSVRFDPSIPIEFADRDAGGNLVPSGTYWVGVGQIFAPSAFHQLYSGSVYNEGSQIIYPPDSANTDQDYIDQFKGAGAYSIDALSWFIYKNPESTPQNSGNIFVYGLDNVDLTTASWRSVGMQVERGSLEELYTQVMTPADLEETVDDTRIFPTIIEFDPPLVRPSGKPVMLMYVNENAAPVFQSTNQSELQRIFGVEEFRSGQRTYDASGNLTDTRANPLELYKALGTVMYIHTEGDSSHGPTWIYSMNRQRLFLNGKPAVWNARVTWVGSVDLVSGVRYHFGKDVADQGVGEITPNPVVSNSRIPFALREASPVKLDLFDASGRHVRNLVDHKYLPGNYSVDLTVDGLQSGTYLVRMTAGEKVYTQKLVITR